MSFIFCPLFKSILNDDIKNRILIKIKEFQCHSEWNTFDLHINISDIEISSINIDDIIKQRNIWKNIAKLLIDLWKDFDYYKKFIFKSKFDEDEYKKGLESLGCVCEEGAWRNVSRPSEEVVQTSVFMYCLYEMMFKEKIGDIYTVIDNKLLFCVFCKSDIKDCEDLCEICGSSKEEREEYQKNIDNGQYKEIGNEVDNDNDTLKPLENNNNNEDESSIIEKNSEMKIINDKWKCGRCEYLNKYTFINCEACEGLYKDGKWNCGKCTLENSCVNNKCEGCGEINVNLIDTECVEGGVNYDYKYGSRIANGLWKCSQCTMINKCDHVECTVCGVMNDNLLIKHCKYCKKNELKRGEVQCGECIKNKCNTWKCPFAHCGELNVKKDDYCQKCRIYYYSSQSRGMPVKVYNQEIYMWICYKCHIYNKMNSNVCECGKKRLKRGMIEKFCDFLK